MGEKRTVLITGCSDGGLGAYLACSFNKAGWRVFASARNMTKLQQASAAGCETVKLDTLSDESVDACVKEISQRTGGTLDLLINNAGAGYSMPVLDLSITQTRDLYELNVFSLIRTTRAFFPLLMASKSGGIVANNTSCSSLPIGALPFAGAYNSSKGAAALLTENMRLEFAGLGVRVVNLMTGSVRSEFQANAPKISLPPDSLYTPAKETVEHAMSGQDNASGAGDPQDWADGVVSQLSRPTPPHWIWGGKHSTTARIFSHLPIGTLDGMIKGMAGLDVVEKKLKEARVEGKAHQE